MNFLAIVLFYLALVVSNTFARLPLPEGYHITKIFPVTNQLKDAEGNLENPLLNATLTCYKSSGALWRNYDLWGTNWYGVTEQSLKHAAASANACMTKWKLDYWNGTECFTNADGSSDCTDDVPMWHASFRHSLVMGSEAVMLLQYDELTGCFGSEGEHARWIMSNGTDTRASSIYEMYPPYGLRFRDSCKWA